MTFARGSLGTSYGVVAGTTGAYDVARGRRESQRVAELAHHGVDDRDQVAPGVGGDLALTLV